MSYILTEAEELRESLAELAGDLQWEAEQLGQGDMDLRTARAKVDASKRILALLAAAPLLAPSGDTSMSRPHDWQLGAKFGVVGLICAHCGRVRYFGVRPQDHSSCCPLTMIEKDSRIRRLVAAAKAQS